MKRVHELARFMRERQRRLQRRQALSAPDRSTSIAQKLLDVPDQLLRPIGLGEESAIVSNLGGARRDFAGGHDELHMRPTVVDAARELHPIECAGHVDVGKQQSHLWPRLEHAQGRLGVRRLEDTEAAFLQDVGGPEAYELFVLRHQDDGLQVALGVGHLMVTHKSEAGFESRAKREVRGLIKH